MHNGNLLTILSSEESYTTVEARTWEDSFTTVKATTNGKNNNENQGNYDTQND